MLTPPTSPPDRVLSKAETASILGISPSTVDRWSRAGRFPAKLQLGPARVGFSQAAVAEWLATR